MKTYNLTWSKGRYLKLMVKEYLLSALGQAKEAYMLRYERDAMLPRSTPQFLLGYLDGRLEEEMRVLDVACGDGD